LAILVVAKEVRLPGMTEVASVTTTATKAGAVTLNVAVPVTVPAAGPVKVAVIVEAPWL
jgi:hypothetical protein